MKTIIVIIILGGLVLGGIYFFGGYKNFDPTKQGRQAQAAIKPGMTVKQVVDIAGRNPKFLPIVPFEHKVGKQTIKEERPGLPVDFDYDRFMQKMKLNQVPTNGFILNYKFSEEIAFDVHFDNNGVVTHLSDAMTMHKLLYPQ